MPMKPETKIAYLQRPEVKVRNNERQKRYYQENREARLAYNKRRYQEVERAKQAQRRWERKLVILEAVGNVCIKCGFSHPAALEFHHRDPEQKEFEVSTRLSLASVIIDELLVEARKCDVLCSNCHRIEHSSLDWDEHV